MRGELELRARRIIDLARERKLTLATVESCTAGTLTHLLSQFEGAGEVLHGGLIVYSKENKMVCAGVPASLLAQHTAVSGEVAQAMAAGGLAKTPADLAAAITGVAGPLPDDDGNRVGLVFVAAAARDGRCRVVRKTFGEAGKQKICALAMLAALDLLEELLRQER